VGDKLEVRTFSIWDKNKKYPKVYL
jgi:hypothetical protein